MNINFQTKANMKLEVASMQRIAIVESMYKLLHLKRITMFFLAIPFSKFSAN
jgi:hypothetical protein